MAVVSITNHADPRRPARGGRRAGEGGWALGVQVQGMEQAKGHKETGGPRGQSQGKKGTQNSSIQGPQWSLQLVLAFPSLLADTEQLLW